MESKPTPNLASKTILNNHHLIIDWKEVYIELFPAKTAIEKIDSLNNARPWSRWDEDKANAEIDLALKAKDKVKIDPAESLSEENEKVLRRLLITLNYLHFHHSKLSMNKEYNLLITQLGQIMTPLFNNCSKKDQERYRSLYFETLSPDMNCHVQWKISKEVGDCNGISSLYEILGQEFGVVKQQMTRYGEKGNQEDLGSRLCLKWAGAIWVAYCKYKVNIEGYNDLTYETEDPANYKKHSVFKGNPETMVKLIQAYEGTPKNKALHLEKVEFFGSYIPTSGLPHKKGKLTFVNSQEKEVTLVEEWDNGLLAAFK